MSSSPPTTPAGSPPLRHTTLPISKKRPSITTATTAPPNLSPSSASKRRKYSTTSTTISFSSAHPLRQTSFPPEGELLGRDERSPSVESSIAGSSVITGFTDGAKANKKARVSKKGARSGTATGGSGRSVDGSSSVKRGRGGAGGKGSKAGSQISGSGGRAGGGGSQVLERASASGSEIDDDDAGADENTTVMNSAAEETAQAKELERRDLAVLIEHLSPAQMERYEAYRRCRLDLPAVRKLANQTLSQSLPKGILNSVSGATKVFIGDLVARAREVQTRWLIAEVVQQEQAQNGGGENGNMDESKKVWSRPHVLNSDGTVNEALRGPLEPDHLREAYRLYKKDREGGGAGYLQLGLVAMNGYASASSGKRLFK